MGHTPISFSSAVTTNTIQKNPNLIMIRVLFSLFTIYELSSGNRLLLQSFQIPSATVSPPAVQTTAAAVPQTTAAQPVAVVPPPTPPPTYPFIPGGISLIPGVTQPPQSLTCTEPCVDTLNCWSECAQTTRTVTNPLENYSLTCSGTGSCAGSTLTFNYGAGGFTEKVNFEFSGMYAAYGTTINVNSAQTARRLKVDKISCKAPGACENLTFIANGADVNDVDCTIGNGACTNCFIVKVPDQPKPCALW